MMSTPEIVEFIESLEKDIKAFKKQLFKLAWYMRGSLNMEQVYQLDITDRNIIFDIIEENLETTKDSGLPFF
jgi:hypothetical protein